jgi:D-alanyl-D-alanine carboxypeptidase (penicillin-binding protein 5/6)
VTITSRNRTGRRSWIRGVGPVATGLGVLSIAAIAFSGDLGWGSSPSPHRHSMLHAIRIEWPAEGQAAIGVAGRGHRSSRGMQPAPIASLAKVMTAYVVLRRDPLPVGGNGFTLTFNDSDVALAASDKSDGQSYAPVEAGETMTEREALEALLLPSANNIAAALADQLDGSTHEFVRNMNSTAAQLGMRHTTYTDPSGFSPSTVSTAADQLRLARAAMRIPAFAEIVEMHDAVIPVAGLVSNTDSLLGRDGFVGIKTGSDQAAGGCFMFESVRRANAHTWRIYGVVLGQTGGSLIRAGLDAADTLVDDISHHLRGIGPGDLHRR